MARRREIGRCGPSIQKISRLGDIQPPADVLNKAVSREGVGERYA